MNILGLSFAVLAGACHAFAQEPAAPPPLVLPASIEPYERTEIHARLSGYVSDVLVDLGDAVKAGDVLVRIERPELLAELVKARVEKAEKESLRDAAAAVERQAHSALAVTRTQVERARVDVHLQETTLQRQEQLHAERAITPQQLDEVRAQMEIAKADAAVAEARLALAEADAASATAKASVAAAQVEVSNASIGAVETSIAMLEVRAPFDGLVVERRVSRGDLTLAAPTTATALFTLQRIDLVRVRADLPERDAHRVGKGTPVTLRRIAGGGAEIEAHVTRTAGALDPRTRTLRVEIQLENPRGELLCGSYLEASFRPAAKPQEGGR